MPDYVYGKLACIEELVIHTKTNLNSKEKIHYSAVAASMRDQVQDSSRARTSAIRLVSADSSIIPLAMRECAMETSWLSGKGSSAYWCSERRSSSSLRVRVDRTVALLSRASHIPSRLDFQGGTGLVTPYFVLSSPTPARVRRVALATLLLYW